MKNLEKTLQLLPLAYLFLIALGILKESIYYNEFGINIMKYASIGDVIMSPISELTSSISVIIGCVLYTFLSIQFVYILKKNSTKKWAFKIINHINFYQKSDEEKNDKFLMLTIGFLISGYIGYFLGFGIIHSKKISEKIESHTILYKDIMKLSNGELIKCYILGSNSQYYFIKNTSKETEIVPIGSISSIINNNDVN